MVLIVREKDGRDGPGLFGFGVRHCVDMGGARAGGLGASACDQSLGTWGIEDGRSATGCRSHKRYKNCVLKKCKMEMWRKYLTHLAGGVEGALPFASEQNCTRRLADRRV